MEDLTRTQVIMLVLLVSFVTSLVTGIVTVTLVNQAPPPVTQTINKVIEKTIETITLSDSGNQIAAIVQPAVITREDLIVRTIRDASSAVVSVVMSKDLPVGETEVSDISSITGFLVSEDGLIVTSKHFIKSGVEYSIVTSNGSEESVDVFELDSESDVAILKVASSSTEKFNFAPVGDSDEIKIGQTVIALGNILGGVQNSVSIGIISGQEEVRNFIQTDVKINDGNYGGPLLDLNGKVVGINIITTVKGGGSILPINSIKEVLNNIQELRGKEEITTEATLDEEQKNI